MAQTTDQKLELRFAYDRSEPAPLVYERLRRAAAKVCAGDGVRSLQVRQQEEACAEKLLDKGVAGIGRSDLADLHRGRMEQQASGGRIHPAAFETAG